MEFNSNTRYYLDALDAEYFTEVANDGRRYLFARSLKYTAAAKQGDWIDVWIEDESSYRHPQTSSAPLSYAADKLSLARNIYTRPPEVDGELVRTFTQAVAAMRKAQARGAAGFPLDRQTLSQLQRSVDDQVAQLLLLLTPR